MADDAQQRQRLAPPSDRFQRLLTQLDELVTVAITISEDSDQDLPAEISNTFFEDVVQRLDEILFQLRLWESDIKSPEPRSAMRDMSTLDRLRVLDFYQVDMISNLHKIFDGMESDALSIVQTVNNHSECIKNVQYPANIRLEKAVDSLQNWLDRLDEQKTLILEETAKITINDIRHALQQDNIVSAKSSVLSIDGGGVRSYSSVLIIKELMDEVSTIVKEEKSKHSHPTGPEGEDVQPGDIFEYVFGSSSGGLIAIMLGRLKMTVEQCLETFQKYADEIFSHSQRQFQISRGLLGSKYSDKRLIRATRLIVGEFDPSPESLKWKRNLFALPGSKCKSGVVAWSMQNQSELPYLFRGYNLPASKAHSSSLLRNPEAKGVYQIWQVVRATSAAPNYFSPITVDGKLFVDGGFGTNNPTLEAFREATWSDDDMPSNLMIISIGSGVGKHLSRFGGSKSKYGLLLKYIESAIRMVSDTERVHQETLMISRERNMKYFRFNVDTGLEDISLDSWNIRKEDGKRIFETIIRIQSETMKYLQRQDVREELRRCAKALVDRRYPGPSTMPPNPSKPLLMIPFSRDPNFVIRPDLMMLLDNSLEVHNRGALVGIGGVGKSQIAIEYCYRFREKFPYSWVFWVCANTPVRLEQDYRAIGDRLELSSRKQTDINIFELVYDSLCDEAKPPWLIVLDDADISIVHLNTPTGRLASRIEDLGGGVLPVSRLLPQTGNGRILVTSRDSNTAFRLTGDHATIIKVKPMGQDQALALLHSKVEENISEDDAVQLVEALDYIPLAITQAVAYINLRAPRITVAKYLEMFRESDKTRAILLSKDSGDLRRDFGILNSILTTWQFSFEHLRIERPSAVNLLSLMSFFEGRDIPDFLLYCYDRDDINFEPQHENNIEFEEDISILNTYSLIDTNLEGRHFSLHRLLQLSIKNWLELRGALEKWQMKCVSVLSRAFPTEQFENRTLCSVLFPHVVAVLAYRPTSHKSLILWASLLATSAMYARCTGNYAKAEEMTRQALEGRLEVLGPQHPDTLTSVNNLAMVLRDQGKHVEAEKTVQSVITRRIEVLGPLHPDTLTSVNHLAMVLRDQGKWVEAEKAVRSVVGRQTKVLGPLHPDTLASVNHLAMVLWDQGRIIEAEKTIRSVVERQTKVLGPQHLDTLMSLNNVAMVLWGQGKWVEAEETIRSVVERQTKVLGPQHLDTLLSIKYLAMVLQDQGKWAEAEKANQSTVERQTKVLGPQQLDSPASSVEDVGQPTTPKSSADHFLNPNLRQGNSMW